MDTYLATFLFLATKEGTSHLLSLQVRQGQMGLRGARGVRGVCVVYPRWGESTPPTLTSSSHHLSQALPITAEDDGSLKEHGGLSLSVCPGPAQEPGL